MSLPTKKGAGGTFKFGHPANYQWLIEITTSTMKQL